MVIGASVAQQGLWVTSPTTEPSSLYPLSSEAIRNRCKLVVQGHVPPCLLHGLLLPRRTPQPRLMVWLDGQDWGDLAASQDCRRDCEQTSQMGSESEDLHSRRVLSKASDFHNQVHSSLLHGCCAASLPRLPVQRDSQTSCQGMDGPPLGRIHLNPGPSQWPACTRHCPLGCQPAT